MGVEVDSGNGRTAAPISSGPITAATPGCARARARSTPRMRACGCGLRTIAATRVPGSGSRSSTKRPAPLTRAASSSRAGVQVIARLRRCPRGGRSPRRRARGAASCRPRSGARRRRRPRAWGVAARAGSGGPRRPSRRRPRRGRRRRPGTTNAVTAWPQRSSGSPTTTTSATAGQHTSAASISSGYTFSPPVLIMSSTRPETHRSPSSSATARSPVKYQPSRTARAVASGRIQ